MISWLQKNFQTHYRTVFMALLAVVIITFIFTIGAMPGLGRAEHGTRQVDVFGIPFTTEADQQELYSDGQTSYLLTGDRSFFHPNILQQHAFNRAAALQLADRLRVPQPTETDLQAFIKSLPAFQGPDGTYDPQAYSRFRDSLQAGSPADQARIARVLRQDWRVAQVTSALGGPGYVLDSEVKDYLARADTRWTVSTATVDLSKVQPAAEPTEEELQQWYEANSFRYQVPERTRVSFVEFRAADFVDRVQVTDEQIVDYFNRNKASYRTPAPPAAEGETPPPAPPEPTLDQVRDKVVADLRLERARQLAAKAASDFAYYLFDQKVERGTEQFDQLLAEHKLQLQTPPPFTASAAPAGTGWDASVVEKAIQLDEDRTVSDPLRVGDNTVVLFFDEKLPSFTPEFAAVKDRVLQDVRQDHRQKAIVAHGEKLHDQLAAAIADGKSFADAAAAAGLETKTWSDFTRRDPPADADTTVLTQLEDLPVRSVSPMHIQGDQGTFVFVADRVAPEVATSGPEFESQRQNLMRVRSAYEAQAILAAMVERELTAKNLVQAVQ